MSNKKEDIIYKKGYKYQLAGSVQIKTSILVEKEVIMEFIHFYPDGWLYIYKGYAWDGPSGPTIDTKTFMRGSLVHDALYQLMRNGLLSPVWRKLADIELKRICLEDGMSKLRAWYVYRAVRRAAGIAASPKQKKKIYCAPGKAKNG